MKDFPECRMMKDFAVELEKIAKNKKIFVVVGGGKVARDYIKIAKNSGANDVLCDLIGIRVTKLNALLFSSMLNSSPKEVPDTFERALELSKLWNIVVMGGTFPGHTTDATAALLAEYVGADLLLNATAVDGVYSEDPKKNPNAIFYRRIKAKELVEIVSKGEVKAGSSNVLDILAAKIVERSGIKTIIFKGEPKNIEKAIYGEIGTVVEP